MEQIHNNMGAVGVLKKWNKAIEHRCNQILGNQPEEELDMLKFKSIPNRRKQNLQTNE